MPIANDVPVEELVTALAGRDQSTVVTQMQALAKSLFQSIFDKGHGVAKAQAVADKAILDGEITGLKTQVTTLTEQNRQLADKAPNVAELQTAHATAIATLEQKHKDALAAVNATLASERFSRAKASLVSHLKDLGVDADFADVTVDKAEKANRLRKNDKGVIEAFRADVDTPFTATDKKDGLMLLAEELKTTVPAKFINVNGDSGAGNSGGTGGANNTGKDAFAKIRADVKAKEAASTTGDTGASRLTGGGTRRAATG